MENKGPQIAQITLVMPKKPRNQRTGKLTVKSKNHGSKLEPAKRVYIPPMHGARLELAKRILRSTCQRGFKNRLSKRFCDPLQSLA